ncbi:hypothetical protein [Endozoicomonas sp. GU-1]|uniref:hypothetical protein n=1 Tax=Endozoicomonas sp. GU-1 TaxID=3009078 RepID=UPI0022B54B5B|nr:hypothetical protein [Endozoicomonas sp. GU-1]WBA82003.1 hypothetical protein O2T12_02210 [Endozoicomonas sp. GU-1]
MPYLRTTKCQKVPCAWFGLKAAGRSRPPLLMPAWSAIQETLHLLDIPGVRESIRDGLASDISDCSEEPGW